MKSTLALLALFLGLLASGNVRADPPLNRVANIWFHQGAWTYHAIYSYEGGSPRVGSVVALAHPETLTGDNLAGVWYVRSATGWEAKSWDSSSPYEVVKALKTELAIPDDFDGYWYLPGASAINAAASAGAAEPYDKGLITSDPVYNWVQSQPDRDAIIASLTALGWKSADIFAEKTSASAGTCDEKSLVTGVAAAAEYAISANSSSGPAVAAAYTLAVAGACGGAPGPKQGVVIGGVRWTTPWPENTTPAKPPEFVKCITLPDGRKLCAWNQPGDWVEHRWCVRYLPPDQQGPPQPLCEQTRHRGNCKLDILCLGDISPPTIPPCEYGPTLDCGPGDPAQIPWVPDNTTSCPDCNWLVPN